MADFSAVLMGRRSIRKFQDRPVPPQVLDQVLTAVQWSPSWANTQCWEVVVVTEPEAKQALQGTLQKGNPAAKALVAAPVVLVLCGKAQSSGYYKGQATTKHGDWMLFDLGIACQSMLLEARNQGLGTVVVGLFYHDQVAKLLGVPKGYEVAAMIPLGYPDHEPKPPARKELDQFVHQGGW